MKKFFITLGLSIGVWLISAGIQAYATFGKYLGTFSRGCQVTGYPIDVCTIQGPNVPAGLIILLNIFFWFFILHLFWNWFDKRKN
ncbi:hypothetical protein HYT74_03095 [Candidatus Daviesbacteria bacterium]|nr:hypothetical protein [Candidatus Daviesbacteria bacterium]